MCYTYDENSRVVVEKYEYDKYDTYGGLDSRTGTTDTPFMYNGRDGVVTDANGLLYMRARNNLAYSLHEKGIGNDYEWTLNYQTSVR